MDMDFPAAHSMDTVWFAVDKDGHIGMFHSGEAGAVPLEAFGGDEAYEASEQLRSLLPRGEMIYDLAGRILPGERKYPLDRAWGRDNVLLFLSSLDPVREALAAGRGVEVKASEGVAVVLRNLSDAELNGYKELPEFRGCVSLYGFDDEGRPLAEHGFYEYMHLTENWISGPYGREAIPARPVHIDQLPPVLREQMESLRFDEISFANTPHIQPVELDECVSWESAYMDVTGKQIRPIPGKEDEYEDAYDDLQDLGGRSGYVIEPPADLEEDEDEE